MRRYNQNIIIEAPAPLNKINKDIIESVSGTNLILKFQQKLALLFTGWITIIIAVIFLLSSLDEFKKYWILTSVLILLGVSILILAHKMPRKIWGLDRINQRLTIPYNLTSKHTTKHIHEVKSGYYIQTGGKSVTIPLIVPVVWHKSKIAMCNYSALTNWKTEGYTGSDIHRTWSFYLWYLDKNRPLPPGNILDPFREEDFQRRKAEGFPPPLICSCIPTLEATPEQQTEREKYWKDEDYLFRLDRYRGTDIIEQANAKGRSTIKMEKDSFIVRKDYNPDNWEKKTYPEFENFKYLKAAYAMRYEFEDGKIAYAYIDKKTKDVYTPQKGINYKKEIIR